MADFGRLATQASDDFRFYLLMNFDKIKRSRNHEDLLTAAILLTRIRSISQTEAFDVVAEAVSTQRDPVEALRQLIHQD